MSDEDKLRRITELEEEAKNLRSELAKLEDHVKSCSSDAPRLIFEAKTGVETFDRRAMSYLLLDDINIKQFDSFRQTYVSMDEVLLNLVDAFAKGCTCLVKEKIGQSSW